MSCSMDDMFHIYGRFCQITSGAYGSGNKGYEFYDELQKTRFVREALAELLKVVQLRYQARDTIFEEICKLMEGLDLRADFSKFSHFYDFVFFICRENGQKNITVSSAIRAWKIVLAGRFRLLREWCIFVEKNQRHNISEDTWRQVLAFSRCVHENLEGYDPEGAWPVLIDDFVEHMYRVRGSTAAPNLFCNCGDFDTQPLEDSLPGLKGFPGSKRKFSDCLQNEEDYLDEHPISNTFMNAKRRYVCATNRFLDLEVKLQGNAADDCMEVVKHNSPSSCSKSPCAVEGCLSKGFAGLLSSRSCLQTRRVSYT